MKASFRAFPSALLLLLCTGCSAKFTSQRYQDLPEGYAYKGASYKLPKSIVKYTINLALYKKNEKPPKVPSYFLWLDETATKENPAISISSSAVGDDSRVYVIDTDDLAAFLVHSKGTGFTIDESGMLTAANGEFEDKTTDVVESVVASGLKIAKFAASQGLLGYSNEEATQEKTFEKIATIPVSGQIDYASYAKRTHPGGKIVCQIPVRSFLKQAEIMFDIKTITLPSLAITFLPPYRGTAVEPASRLKLKGGSDTAKQNGIWVQQPADVEVNVILSGYSVLNERLLIADAGAVTLLPIKSRVATDRNTIIAFHPKTGGLNTHSFTTTSQGEKIATSAGKIVDNVAKDVPEIQAATEKRITDLKATDDEIIAQSRELKENEILLKENQQKANTLDLELKQLSGLEEPEDPAEKEALIKQKEQKQTEATALQGTIRQLNYKVTDLKRNIILLNEKRDRQ